MVNTDTLRGLEQTEIVNGTTTIGECINLMHEKKISAIVVANSAQQIEGIFTDRDVFLKIARAATQKPFWEYPVQLIMSRPVFMLPPDLVHLAAEYMADHQVRHIPIVTKHTNGKHEIHGLITQDSLFRSNVTASRAWRNYVVASPDKTLTVGIISDDLKLSNEICKILNVSKQVQARRIRKEELANQVLQQSIGESFNHIILDADSFDSDKFKKLLTRLASVEHLERLVLICSPDGLNKSLLKDVKLIHKSKPIQLILKPVDSATISELFMSVPVVAS